MTDMIVAHAQSHKTVPFTAHITSPIIRERRGEFAGLFLI